MFVYIPFRPGAGGGGGVTWVNLWLGMLLGKSNFRDPNSVTFFLGHPEIIWHIG